MLEWLFTLVLLLLVVSGMALGLLRGKRIQGSCGGLNQIPGVESDCGGTCRNPCEKRAKQLRNAT